SARCIIFRCKETAPKCCAWRRAVCATPVSSPCMLIHDGILLEARNDEQVEHAIEIMRKAGQDVCNGLEIGVDVDQRLEHGARYQDKRPLARQMWATIMGVLEAARAIPRKGPAWARTVSEGASAGRLVPWNQRRRRSRTPPARANLCGYP